MQDFDSVVSISTGFITNFHQEKKPLKSESKDLCVKFRISQSDFFHTKGDGG